MFFVRRPFDGSTNGARNANPGAIQNGATTITMHRQKRRFILELDGDMSDAEQEWILSMEQVWDTGNW
jgi:hypothetical protein